MDLSVVGLQYGNQRLSETFLNQHPGFECKYYQKPVDSSIIKDFEKKIKALRDFKNYSLKKVLVSPNGASQELKDSDYFDFIISTEDFFK